MSIHDMPLSQALEALFLYECEQADNAPKGLMCMDVPAGIKIAERLADDVMEAAWRGEDEHGGSGVGKSPLWHATEVLDEATGALWYFKQVLDALERGPAGQERIYISGPYTAPTPEQRDLHVLRAREAAGALLRRGHWPFCPHTMTAGFEDHFPDIPYMTYIAADLAWLPFCHSILLLPDWRESRGAVIEHEHAEKLALTIYEDMSEVPDLRMCADRERSDADCEQE